jgi:hypothetical protein
MRRVLGELVGPHSSWVDPPLRPRGVSLVVVSSPTEAHVCLKALETAANRESRVLVKVLLLLGSGAVGRLVVGSDARDDGHARILQWENDRSGGTEGSIQDPAVRMVVLDVSSAARHVPVLPHSIARVLRIPNHQTGAVPIFKLDWLARPVSVAHVPVTVETLVWYKKVVGAQGQSVASTDAATSLNLQPVADNVM